MRKEKIEIIISMACILGFMFTWYFMFVNAEKVQNNTAVRLWCFSPSIVELNEEFEIRIQAWDKWEQLAIQYDQQLVLEDYIINIKQGNLQINNDPLSYTFPIDLKFTPSKVQRTYGSSEYYPTYDNDGGCLKVSGLLLRTPGIHYIKVLSTDGLTTFSNPIVVANNPNNKLYWGDIHGHTDYSDGTGTPEFAYYYAREVAGLDYAAVTDHDMIMSTAHKGTYPLDVSAANRFNEPGKFVTLVAYEWTGLPGYGHINMYYKNDYGPMYSMIDPQTNDMNKLFNALKQWKGEDPLRDVIAIPHHPTSSGNYFDWSYDWRTVDPELVPVVEMYSCHGSGEMTEAEGNSKSLSYLKDLYYEMGEGFTVQSALSMGYKIGFISSSDTHDARLGHPLLHIDNYGANYPFATLDMFRATLPLPGGLTACWANNLTRNNIFYGIKNRNVYATTHVSRPYLTFSINDISPGMHDSTILINSANSPRNIKVSAAVDGNYEDNSLVSVEIIKNNKVWAKYNTSGFYNNEGVQIWQESQANRKYLELNLVDSEKIVGMTYTGGEFVNGTGYKITEGADNLFSDQPSTNGVDVYYVRITDSFSAEGWGWTSEWNGNQAWIGPLWVKSL